MADVFGNEVIDLVHEQALCGFCQGNYSVLFEVVCGECERRLCPLCATRSRKVYRCPECTPTGTFAAPKPC